MIHHTHATIDIHFYFHIYPKFRLTVHQLWMYMDIIMETPKIQIISEFVKLVAEIDEFKGKWQVLRTLAPDQLARLKQIASIESIGSSTRIEGAKLSDSQVEQLLSDLDIHRFRSRDEEEVAGYAAAMEMVFEFHDEIRISENNIKQLHQILLKYSSKDARHRGEYKKFPNHVEAIDSDGKSLGIIFETASPFETPSKMSGLVAWFKEEWENRHHHPLFIITLFIVHFLAIHPFQDGNGRLSRILTTLLLMRAGYAYTPFSSMERVIEENKDHYYLSLRRAQSTLYTDDSKLNEWISFFLKALKKQVTVLESKIEMEAMILELPPLSQEVLHIAGQQGRVTVREIQKVTGANRNTIKSHIKKLVQRGELIQMGSGKGTWYRLS